MTHDKKRHAIRLGETPLVIRSDGVIDVGPTDPARIQSGLTEPDASLVVHTPVALHRTLS